MAKFYAYVNKQIFYASKIFKLDLNYFTKQGFWIFQSYILSVITGFILSFLYANYLPKNVYGEFNYVLSLFSILGIFSLPGMGQALTQSFMKNLQGNYYIAIRQTLLFSLLGTIVLFLIAGYYLFTNHFDLAQAILILSILFPFISISTYYQARFISKKQFKKMSIINISGFIISFTFLSLSIIFYPKTPILITASLLPPLLINLYFTIKELIKGSKIKTDNLYIKLGWNLSVTNSIHFFTKSVDKIIIGLILPIEDLAIYSFAQLIPDQVNSLVRQIFPLLVPKIANLSKKNIRNTLIRKFLLAEILMICIIIPYIILAPIVFRFFFPQYQSSILITQIYSLNLLSIPTIILNLVFQKFKKNTFFYIQELTLLTIIFILSILFIIKWGILGAVIAQVAARIFYPLIAFIQFQFFLKKRI